MIAAVIFMIVLVVVLLYVFDRMKRRNTKESSVESLLIPLHEWEEQNMQHINLLSEKHEELEEAKNMVQLHISDNKRRNLEQRAKLSLVNSITPFIDRMIHEVDRLKKGDDPEEVK